MPKTKRSGRPRGFRNFHVDGEDYWVSYEGKAARIVSPTKKFEPFEVDTFGEWSDADIERYTNEPMKMIADGIRARLTTA